MQIKKLPCLASAVALFIALTQVGIPCSAQTVHKNPDGTVEVTDDDTSYNPAPAPVSRSSGGKASKGRGRGGSSGRIPAYTKRMGGVNVHRNADGTVEVTDTDMKTTWNGPAGGSSGGRRAGKSGRGGSVGAYSKHHGDVAVKRNADGTVEVTDTSSTTRRKK